MVKQQKHFRLGLWIMLSVLMAGCSSLPGNDGQVQTYPAPVVEAVWIRDGQPIEYDGYKWYPVNDYEVMEDSEVYQIGIYKGVQIFVEKTDTKPYDRIYTKFDKNKFRYFERREDD